MRATKLNLILVTAIALNSAVANAEIPQARVVQIVSAVEGGSSAVREAGQLAAPRTMAAPEGLHFASLSPTPTAQAAVLEPSVAAAPPSRSKKDLLALVTIGGMLVAYQLFRKHRLLRQQPFSL